jgi:hypothetical protein
MESHGWTISAAEYAEDWVTDKSSSDPEGNWDDESGDRDSENDDFGTDDMDMDCDSLKPWEWY